MGECKNVDVIVTTLLFWL